MSLPHDGNGQDPLLRSARSRRFLQRLRSSLPNLRFDRNGYVALGEKDPEHLRLLTLNLAHGRRRGPHQVLQPRQRLERNLDAVAEVLREASADVVALQEADGPSSWSGNFDHVEHLARLTGLPHFYRGEHSNVEMGNFQLTYGTALLGRIPLVNAESHPFGKNWRDTKGFVVASTRIEEWKTDIDVVSAHLDFLAPSVRRLQVAHMIDVLAHRDRPLIVLGDLNCSGKEDPRTMQLLTRSLGLRAYLPEVRIATYPAIRPLRRLDWILISDDLEFSATHTVLPHHVSDHLPVVADLHPR